MIGGAVIEAVLVAGVLLAVFAFPAFRHRVSPLGSFERAGLCALGAMILLGHFIGPSTRTFPFVAWNMYSREMAVDRVYHRVVVVDAAGQPVRLDMKYPGTGHRALSRGLELLARQVHEAATPEERRRRQAAMHGLIRVLGRREITPERYPLRVQLIREELDGKQIRTEMEAEVVLAGDSPP
jgi:hypothetical protein